MRVLYEDKLYDTLLDQPLLVLFTSQPLHITILFIISTLARSILDLVVDLFEFIDASDLFLKERTLKILLSDLKLPQLTYPIGILWLYDQHVVLEDLNDPVKDILIKLFDFVLREIIKSIRESTAHLLC